MRNIDINLSHNQLIINEEQIVDMFHFLDESFGPEKIPNGDLSVAFIDHDTMCQLHSDFLNDPEHTDVMTFPGDIEDGMSGELCVSADYARESAPQHDFSFSDELTLYLLHGWLHLAGHDDLSDEPRVKMREAEKRIMAAVRSANKLPSFTLEA